MALHLLNLQQKMLPQSVLPDRPQLVRHGSTLPHVLLALLTPPDVHHPVEEYRLECGVHNHTAELAVLWHPAENLASIMQPLH